MKQAGWRVNIQRKGSATKGIVRVTFALHLKAASYNLKRLVFLKEGGLAPF